MTATTEAPAYSIETMNEAMYRRIKTLVGTLVPDGDVRELVDELSNSFRRAARGGNSREVELWARVRGIVATFPALSPAVDAEVDLVTCPIRPGDRIEMLCEVPDMADGVMPGERYTVGTIRSEQERNITTTDRGGHREGAVWYFGRNRFRLLVSEEFPEVPASVDRNVAMRVRNALATNMYDEMCDRVSCACRAIRGNVDTALEAMARNDIDTSTLNTEEGKRWVGEVLRWQRARLTRNRYPDVPTVSVPEPEPMPERNLDRQQQGSEDLAAPQQTVELLTARVTDLEARRDELLRWQQRATLDMQTISNRFIEEANNRGWCSDYDQIVSELNDSLSVLGMEIREDEREMLVSGYIRVPFTYSITVTGSRADDSSDWTERAEEQFSANVDANDIRNGGSYDRYSAEIEDDLNVEFA